MEQWARYEGVRFDLAGPALRERWGVLHAGNKEPYPSDDRVQDAWRAYHEGRFQDAVTIGQAHGGAGLVPAAFAATIYANYLESDEDSKVAIFETAMDMAEKATEACPDNANAHYMLAVSRGRYSQFINMIEALSKGLGPKIRDSVTRCLELQPDHAEGHATMAGWNAEIVDKVGGMLAGALIHISPSLPELHLSTGACLEGTDMTTTPSRPKRTVPLHPATWACRCRRRAARSGEPGLSRRSRASRRRSSCRSRPRAR